MRKGQTLLREVVEVKQRIKLCVCLYSCCAQEMERGRRERGGGKVVCKEWRMRPESVVKRAKSEFLEMRGVRCEVRYSWRWREVCQGKVR